MAVLSVVRFCSKLVDVNFPSIFPQQFLLCSAKPGAWEYSLSDYTDQPTLVLVEDTIREKLFLHLHKEIPYLVTQVNEVVFLKCVRKFGLFCYPMLHLFAIATVTNFVHIACIPCDEFVIGY